MQKVQKDGTPAEGREKQCLPDGEAAPQTPEGVRAPSELHHRVEQLDTLYQLSTLLAAHRDLQELLDTAARSAAEVMKVKAASIRLLDDNRTELVIKSVFNLSPEYLNKGPILVERSELTRLTLEGRVVYVEDMADDPRVLYPQDAKREGLVSILTAPMIFQNRPIGTVRLYTATKRSFSDPEVNLLQAIARLLATAIENARLRDEHQRHEQLEAQIRLATDVQRRMLPATMPNVPRFDIHARYHPCYELGGDFYDFIDFDGSLGVAVGDVVGKGIAASLLMASVRASLRAYAQDIYDLDEIIERLNIAMTLETRDNEFATLFYGVIDPATMRMTYCSAGHEPTLLLRRGLMRRLETGGMIVGIDCEQKYEKEIVLFEPGDMLLAYTDGLTDAQHFTGERFGRDRIEKAMRDAADESAADASNHILWEMRRFIGLNPQVDDTTIVVVKVV